MLDENVYAVSIEENGKLGKNQNVTLPVLLSICEYLNVILEILWKRYQMMLIRSVKADYE